MPTNAHHYRIRFSGAAPSQFANWFPALTIRVDSASCFVAEGPVTDACQLAGIVSAICSRNGEILNVERLDSAPPFANSSF